MTSKIILAALLALGFAGAAHGGDALPVTRHMLTEKTSLTDASLAYPQTGLRTIDDDIKALITKRAAEFKKLAEGYGRDKGGGGRPTGAYGQDVDYRIARNDAQVFAVIWDEETDFHGAHPSHDIFVANYLRPDGWRIYLPEILDGERGIAKLAALAGADLNRRLTGPDGISDKDTIAEGTKPVATNFADFALLVGKVHIEFPQYQVASYAAGPQAVDVPLAKLADVMRRDWRAPQASFPCVAAHAPIEIAICSDAHLARLDRQVAETYFLHLGWVKSGALGTPLATLENEQRAWLATRDKACHPTPGYIACLTGLYRARLDKLESLTL